MKILVLAKEVPDTASTRTLNADNGLLDRNASEPVPDEINERTLEHALQYRDRGGDAEIVVLMVAPSTADASLRRFLAMGADSAVLVSDEAIAGADAVRTAQLLSTAINAISPDLVLAGNESTDGRTGMVPTMIAEYLNWPVLPSLGDVEITPDTVSGSVALDGELATLRADFPAIVSVTERSAEPRFPNFKGIMQAKKKPLQKWALADLAGVEAPTASSVMVAAELRPAREAGVKIVDDGTAAGQLADFLASNRLI